MAFGLSPIHTIRAETVATATLTVSLVVAATAVSMDNKLLTRGYLVEKTTVLSPPPR